MSARTKINGNRAIKCNAHDCQAVYIAAWWGSDAAGARAEAGGEGWRRELADGRDERRRLVWVDLCPANCEGAQR